LHKPQLPTHFNPSDEILQIACARPAPQGYQHLEDLVKASLADTECPAICLTEAPIPFFFESLPSAPGARSRIDAAPSPDYA
jgi:hypothetical protein